MKVSQPLLAAISLVLASCGSVAAEEPKQVLHITGPRELFDAFYDTNKESLDLWSATTHSDGTIDAQVYGPPSMISQLQGSHARGLREGDHTHNLRVLAAEGATDTSSAAKKEKLEVSACHKETYGYIGTLGAGEAALTSSKFHDCWRTSDQVFEYLDKLTKLAPKHLTKIDSIGKTFEGRDIPVYKISTGNKGGKKQALMGQALIHSREWQTGGAVFYIISGLLDGLRAKDPRVTAIFDKYDWYFVPILNIDGYEHTWTDGNRLWRKNRRTFTVEGKNFVGVDLNRNFGPTEFFDLTGDSTRPNTEIYPGTGVLSEPESAAVFRFLRALPIKLAGLIDVHMNSQSVLRPFSNQVTEAAEPYQTKLMELGGEIQRSIQRGSDLEYRNVMGGTGSYLAYGTFKDAVYMELGGVPAYTLELERADGGFISSQSTIRDVGNRTLSAFLAFSQGVEAYWRG